MKNLFEINVCDFGIENSIPVNMNSKDKKDWMIEDTNINSRLSLIVQQCNKVSIISSITIATMLLLIWILNVLYNLVQTEKIFSFIIVLICLISVIILIKEITSSFKEQEEYNKILSNILNEKNQLISKYSKKKKGFK